MGIWRDARIVDQNVETVAFSAVRSAPHGGSRTVYLRAAKASQIQR